MDPKLKCYRIYKSCIHLNIHQTYQTYKESVFSNCTDPITLNTLKTSGLVHVIIVYTSVYFSQYRHSRSLAIWKLLLNVCLVSLALVKSSPLLRIFCEHLFESVLIRMFGMQYTVKLGSPLWSAAIWQRAALACACWWEQRYNVFCQHALIIKRASVGYGKGRCHFSS